MPRSPLPRIDGDPGLRKKILEYCRLAPGEIWEDPVKGHRVGIIDATDSSSVEGLCANTAVNLVINDPPYNFTVGKRRSNQLFSKHLSDYMSFCRSWVTSSLNIMAENSYLYAWMGADQKEGFQPLPDFMVLMRGFSKLRSKSFITLRNQRGFGTQRNWMSLRQELLCYQKGNPPFVVRYTGIPKILKGYYKKINGTSLENIERSKSKNIRPGNVWIDIQQVFYRLKENVPGAYAQKPLSAVERIIQSSSLPEQTVADLFSHSGTTLLGCERLDRRCITADIDPVFAELTIRRLERYRRTGVTGWQWENPFPEIGEYDQTHS